MRRRLSARQISSDFSFVKDRNGEGLTMKYITCRIKNIKRVLARRLTIQDGIPPPSDVPNALPILTKMLSQMDQALKGCANERLTSFLQLSPGKEADYSNAVLSLPSRHLCGLPEQSRPNHCQNPLIAHTREHLSHCISTITWRLLNRLIAESLLSIASHLPKALLPPAAFNMIHQNWDHISVKSWRKTSQYPFGRPTTVKQCQMTMPSTPFESDFE